MFIETVLAMSLAVVLSTVGDILMAKGLKSLGDVQIKSLAGLWQTVKRVVHTPCIFLGVALMLSFFVIWLSVLSWADLSLALPMTAMTYVLNALLARPFMGETVSPKRWLGTVIIFIGVIIVTASGRT